MYREKNTIIDNEGRTLILRGVNLGGSSKNPFGPPGWGQNKGSLLNPENVSFVGRPFPLEDADSHFERLSKAGMTFLRFIITWEALEHAGPGQYDEEYLAYLRKILLTAEKYGISVFLDPHQDVWSRWTGGDGAPAWTLEIIGIDLDKIDITESAVTCQRYSEFHKGAPYPRMIWPSNYNRYAAASMFSLFFGGKTYAPQTLVNGENIQDFLQTHYINAFRHCFRRLKNCKAIAGWGVMNEPHFGFIGLTNLARDEKSMVPVGPRPSPWHSMLSASGYTVKVPYYETLSMGLFSTKKVLFNPHRISLFKEEFECPWKRAGVWTDAGGEVRLLKADHFNMYCGRQANFLEDFHKPFTLKFIEKMNEADEKTIFFIEGLPSGATSGTHHKWENTNPQNVVNAFHWYDGFSLFTKTFNPNFTIHPDSKKFIFGRKKIQKHFIKCLKEGLDWSETEMGNMPCLLGEFGLAFDINKRKAYKTGDYSLHEEALSMYFNAVDANLLHSTIWNYTADNINQYGDDWNEEDLSIFSQGKERAEKGWKRPYPMATAGKPIEFSWDIKTGIFRFSFIADSSISSPSIIYLPVQWFTENPKIEIECDEEDAAAKIHWEYKAEEQRLFIYNNGYSGQVKLTVIRN